MSEPVLQSGRLTLRPIEMRDAPEIQRLAGAREIADGTLTIPHPYPEGAAEQWILQRADQHQKTGTIVLAIIEKSTGAFCGTIGLHVSPENERAELGYWIGIPFWNRGYTTEAARGMIEYGFGVMRLRRIYAMHYSNNLASGRVLQKLGMKYEGRLRQHVKKWDEFRDLEIYSLLAGEWAQSD